MSRIPCTERCRWCQNHVRTTTVEVGIQTEMLSEESAKEVGEQLSPTTDGVKEPQPTTRTVKIQPEWTLKFLTEHQIADPTLKAFIELKKSSSKRPAWEEISHENTTFKALWAQWERLEIQDDVLYRKWENECGDKFTYQIVLPLTLREQALEAHHNHTTASHRGVRKTLLALRMRFYWPGLTAQVHRWVTRCHQCGAKKSPGKKRRAPLQQYLVGAPMERIAMDILGPLSVTPRGNRYVLVISDYFTKWTESYAIPDQAATTVAEKVVSEYVCRFGVPRQIHSDQGTNFESKVMAEICKLLDIEKTRTTALHPQSDGQVERFNRTLVEMLRGKLQEDQKDWDLQLPYCMMAYRSAVHESTGYTPNQLMLGREVEIPLDVITEKRPDELPMPGEYSEALRRRLAESFEYVQQHLKQAATRQKRNYDKKLAWRRLQVGESVWLHNIRRKKGRTAKLDCPWEGPFLVVAALSDVVYRIKKTAKSKSKVVHVDRLKPYLGPPLKSWITGHREGKRERKDSGRVEEKKGKKGSGKPEEKKGKKDSERAEERKGKKDLGKEEEKKEKKNRESEEKRGKKDQRKEEEKKEKQDQEQTGSDRPKRTIKAPKRLGDWV